VLAFGSDQLPELPRGVGGVRGLGGACAEDRELVGGRDAQDRVPGASVGVAGEVGVGGGREEVQAEPYQLLPQRRSVLLADLEGSLNSLGDSFRSSADRSAEAVGSLFSQVGLATFGDTLALNPARAPGAPSAEAVAAAVPAAGGGGDGGDQPTEDLRARYADIASACLDQVLDVEGLQWGRVTESGGVEISRLLDAPPGAGGEAGVEGEVLRARLRVAAAERAVARVVWDWSKRTSWDKSCRECRFVHKFDSHHSFLALSHASTARDGKGGVGEGAGGADAPRAGGLVELQVLLSRRILPASPASGDPLL